MLQDPGGDLLDYVLNLVRLLVQKGSRWPFVRVLPVQFFDEPSPFSPVEWLVRSAVEDVRDDLDFNSGAEVSFRGFVRVNLESCVVPEWLCSDVCRELSVLQYLRVIL